MILSMEKSTKCHDNMARYANAVSGRGYANMASGRYANAAIGSKLWSKLASGLLLAIIANPVTTYSLTLSEAIKQAFINQNPEFLNAAAQRKAADAQFQNSISGYLPSIDASINYGRDKNTNATTNLYGGSSVSLSKREYSTALSQTLFDGFYYFNKIKADKYRVLSARKMAHKTFEDVIFSVINSYMRVLQARKAVLYAKSNVDEHQKLYQQIQIRTSSGVGRKADSDHATARLALAKTSLINQQAALKEAEFDFYQVVGRYPDEVVQDPALGLESLPHSEQALLAYARQHHPELLQATLNVNALEHDRIANQAAFYPDVKFILSMNRVKNGSGVKDSDNRNVFAGVQVKYNLFKGGSDIAIHRKSVWDLEAAKQSKYKIERMIDNEAKKAWNEYVSTKAELEFRQKHVNAIESTKTSYKQQFNLGQRSLLDLLDSENEYFNARVAFSSSGYAVLLSKYRLLYAAGNLAEVLHISLPAVVTKEPSYWREGF